jgi:hypothetical protein
MISHLYRFRPADAVLDKYEELAKQEIKLVVKKESSRRKGIAAAQEMAAHESPSYLQGATMYTHDGGATDSIHARYDGDWSWWRKHWLGQ